MYVQYPLWGLSQAYVIGTKRSVTGDGQDDKEANDAVRVFISGQNNVLHLPREKRAMVRWE